MADDYNVFISWSGDQSRLVALALREWLPRIIQACKPWMSDTDIEKGVRGQAEINKAVGGIKLGIVCLTPENLAAPWVLFEAGALSKTVDNRERVYTFLISGLEKQDVKPPLSMFQATKAEEEDTRKMFHDLNGALGNVLTKEDLNASFDSMWPKLEGALRTASAHSHKVTPKREVPDMVAEILDLVRAISRGPEPTTITNMFGPSLGFPASRYYGSADTGPGGPAFRTFPISGLLVDLPTGPTGPPPPTAALPEEEH